jgi:hypothetical protein
MHTLPFLSQANRVPCFFLNDADMLKHNAPVLLLVLRLFLNWHRRSMVLPEWD